MLLRNVENNKLTSLSGIVRDIYRLTNSLELKSWESIIHDGAAVKGNLKMRYEFMKVS